MRSASLLLAATLAIALPLAGCISDDGPEADPPTTPEPPAYTFDFGNATWPTGEAARDYIESYVMTHPFRLNQQATATFMATARDSLETLLSDAGLEVVRHDYGSGVNMLGIHNGTTNPEQWVVLSAHYDTTETTIYGGWDDGAGVAALLAIGETLGTWELPFTVVLAFFDEEEQGLVGSRHFVQTYLADESIELVANLNMDPPGLNWPCGDALGPFPVKIIHNMGNVETHSRYAWLYDATEHGLNATEVPADVRDYTPGIPIAVVGGVGLRGTSDHANFDAAGIANVFLGGTPTTSVPPGSGGVVAALTYALHTPLDTLQQMEARCATGAGTLADGLQTIVTTVGHTLQYMAETGVPTE